MATETHQPPPLELTQNTDRSLGTSSTQSDDEVKSPFSCRSLITQSVDLAFTNQFVDTALPEPAPTFALSQSTVPSLSPEELDELNPGGDYDAATYKDTLGREAAAIGSSAFLVAPGNRSMTMAVYGPWGSGKSSYMKIMEKNLLMLAGRKELDQMAAKHQPNCRYQDHIKKMRRKFHKLVDTINSPSFSEASSQDELECLRALAAPQIVTVWFNAWQYVTEEQVWGGLVVELARRLEERVQWKQYRLMRSWASASKYNLHFFPAYITLVWLYHWRNNKVQIFAYVIIPIIAVLVVVVAALVFGIQLLSDGDGTLGASVAVGSGVSIGTVWGLIKLTVSQIKPISDTLVQSMQDMQAASDQSSKIGYQHKVIHDLKELKYLLEGQLKPFAFTQTHCNCSKCRKAPAAAAKKPAPKTTKAHAPKTDIEQPPQKDQAPKTDIEQPPRKDQAPKQKVTTGQSNGAEHENDGRLQLVMFIDDLDRCKPSSVVEVLEAISLVLGSARVSVVVGMDKSFIRRALKFAYNDVEMDDSKAEEFMQKIVQVAVHLPRPSKQELDEFLQNVMEQESTLAGNAVFIETEATPLLMKPSQQPVSVQTGLSRPAASLHLTFCTFLKESPAHDKISQLQDMMTSLTAVGNYTHIEQTLIRQLHSQLLLSWASPREIKRLLNQHHLAKTIIKATCHLASKSVVAEAGTAAYQHCFTDRIRSYIFQWVFLWWYCPDGMTALMIPLQELIDKEGVPNTTFLEWGLARLPGIMTRLKSYKQDAPLLKHLDDIQTFLTKQDAINRFHHAQTQTFGTTKYIPLFRIPVSYINSFKLFGAYSDIGGGSAGGCGTMHDEELMFLYSTNLATYSFQTAVTMPSTAPSTTPSSGLELVTNSLAQALASKQPSLLDKIDEASDLVSEGTDPSPPSTG